MQTLLIKTASNQELQKFEQLAEDLGLKIDSIDSDLIEAWEDFRLGKAMQQAEGLPLVSKEEVLKVLRESW